ncbi:hypothetical protein BKD09_01665 [Bradyrhizobium japonicum]|uniref:Uncharacterized protein n=1 Tax=Bradyrhizobium japonicum TaxID=375 RepID=A0A1L3F162_BRAJP|nr:hypothetical protein BKD09_01665 [Bradyrhizobium japonicum]
MPVNEFIGSSPFAVHDHARAPGLQTTDGPATDGFGLMRKRLIAWTILTCALLAVAVWGLLGAPDTGAGPHLPSRSQTAAVR